MTTSDSEQPNEGGNDNQPVGRGNPPVHSRFKPGQSGNPKGRPEGAKNMDTLRRGIYFGTVPLRIGKKIRNVPRILALEWILMNKAMKGDLKATQLVLKLSEALGALKADLSENPMGINEKQVAALKDPDLQELIRIVRSVDHLRSAA